MYPTNMVSALALLALIPSGKAYPSLQARASGPVVVTEAQLIQIEAKTATCEAKDKECTTAKKAATFISNSFKTYQITSPAVAAGLIATMMQESQGFKYAHNVSPGRPGQGTRNMQMPNFNAEYLKDIKELAPQAAEVGTDMNKILALLIKYGDYNFGSAAWYFKKHCTPDVQKGLESGKKDGWDNYVKKCVEADANDGREKYWEAAIKAMGGSSGSASA